MRRKAPRPVSRSEETPEFQEYWSIWQPHMNQFDGRGDARKVFFHHVEEYRADPRDIIDGSRWFIRDGGNQGVDRDGKPVRIHAASWMNKFAYEDAADKERDYQKRLAERESNVVSIKPQLPENHFSRQWEKAHGTST
jgi:hypothetical protein